MTSNDANEVLNEEWGKVVTDNLKKAGWSLGLVSALDLEGRTIWGLWTRMAAESVSSSVATPIQNVSQNMRQCSATFVHVCLRRKFGKLPR
jgi:hypothetical protein